MDLALEDAEDYGWSTRGAAKKWGIPTSTLSNWLGGVTTKRRKGPPTVLTEEEESLIIERCKEMAVVGQGLEIVNLKTEVAQICETRNNPFKNGLPGKSWWTGFKRRHPDLCLRTTQGQDRDRAINLRQPVVSAFYDTLEKAYVGGNYGP